PARTDAPSPPKRTARSSRKPFAVTREAPTAPRSEPVWLPRGVCGRAAAISCRAVREMGGEGAGDGAGGGTEGSGAAAGPLLSAPAALRPESPARTWRLIEEKGSDSSIPTRGSHVKSAKRGGAAPESALAKGVWISP